MIFPFEAKYINIRYVNKKIIGSIKESEYQLPIEKINSSKFLIEAITYSKLDTGQSGQLAFKLLDDSINVTPYFLTGNDKVELIPVKDPDTNQVWWVENGRWKNSRNSNGKIIYRDSVICRKVGSSTIKMGQFECLININSLSFSFDQLIYYIGDFKDSLSELIWDDSYVTASLPGQDIKLANESLLNLVLQFVRFTEKIIGNPKIELREQQSKKRYKEVRPVSKTFMELATKGITKELTSRDYIESLNVAENRYIYSISNRIYIQIKTLHRLTERRILSLKKECEKRDKRLGEFSDYIKINQASCESYIADLKIKLKEEYQRLAGCVSEETILKNTDTAISRNSYLNLNNSNLNNNSNIFYIKVTAEPKELYGMVEFLVHWKKNTSDEWSKLSENHYLKYKFENNILDNGFKFRQYNEYKVIAEVLSNRFFKKLRIYNVGSIYEISQEFISRKMYFQVTSPPKLEDGLVIFYGKAKKEIHDEWYEINNNKFLFKFDEEIFSEFFTFNNKDNVYKIEGATFKSTRFKSENGNMINTRHFSRVDSLSIIHSGNQQDIDKYCAEIEALKRDNWKRKLTRDEKKEQEREKAAVEKTLQIVKKDAEKNKEIFNHFNHILPRLKKVICFFKKNKVRKEHYFPGSMTFIQNPQYLGSHKTYKQIKEASGIDEGLFDLWQESENIGILDIPAIYERWCLLQIIKILIDKYKFVPMHEDWKRNLLMQVVKSKYNIELTFNNENIGKRIRLTYEKEMKNINRRPDFVMEVRSLKNKGEVKTLIMDAKFREEAKFPGDISALMTELYFDKNYSEDKKNTVYILHPSIKPIQRITNPQLWGMNSFYGEDFFENNGDGRPKHQYGAILMSPFYYGYNSHLDDLQRLIGLYLQYNFEDTNDCSAGDEESKRPNSIDPMPAEKLFCLVCGSGQVHFTKKPAGQGNCKYICNCNDCHHYFVINYCGGCKKRLWKHGQYWTYHKTHAFEPYNIQCPSCGELVAQRKEDDE